MINHAGYVHKMVEMLLLSILHYKFQSSTFVMLGESRFFSDFPCADILNLLPWLAFLTLYMITY